MSDALTSTIGLTNASGATLYWYVVRGSGFVVYLLLTLAVILGLLLSLRWRTDSWPRVITEDLHQFVLLVSAVFLAIHIATTVLDTFVHFTVLGVLIPFAANYRPIWFSMGIISMYLAIALALSSYLRRFIGYRLWRTLHYGGFFAWVLALAHSVATGTDTRATWATVVYAGSVLAVAACFAVRFGGIPVRLGRPPRFRPRVLLALCAVLTVGVGLFESGPLQRGWAARSGGVAEGSPASTTASTNLPSTTVDDVLSGTATTENSTSLNPGTALLHMKITAHGAYPLTLSYGILLASDAGGAQFIRGVFSLAPPSLNWNCTGSVQYSPPDTLRSTCTVPHSSTLQMTTVFQVDAAGTISGHVTLVPSVGASNGQTTSTANSF